MFRNRTGGNGGEESLDKCIYHFIPFSSYRPVLYFRNNTYMSDGIIILIANDVIFDFNGEFSNDRAFLSN